MDHLPADSRLFQVERTWAPWHPEAADLSGLSVRAVTAVLYRTTGHWSMPRRVIHDDMLFLVTAGQGWCQVAGSPRIPLGPQRMAVLPTGVPHAAGHDPRAPLTVIAVHGLCRLTGGVPLFEVHTAPPVVTVTPVIAAVLTAMCRVHATRPPGAEAALADSLAFVWRDLAAAGHLRRRADAAGDAGVAKARVRLAPAAAMLRGDLTAAVPALAARVHLSVAQFRRLVHAATGLSPIAWRTRLRLEESRRLLSTTTLPIEVIAQRCGWAEAATFARAFRGTTGLTPGAYRLSAGM